MARLRQASDIRRYIKHLEVSTLTIKDANVITALLLASGQIVDLNGEAYGLVLDADQDTAIGASVDDIINIKVAGAEDFRIAANLLRALSGSVIETNTINETTAANGVDIDGLKIKDATLQAWKKNVIAKTADFTADAAESGCIYEIGGVDKVATLPATSPGVVFRFQIAAAGLSASTGFKLSPNSNDKLMGNGFTSADNKDAILAGSGDREGDYIEVTGDAGGAGWFITDISGTWTREA